MSTRPVLELTMRAGSDRFGPHHESWIAQQSDLLTQLAAEAGSVRQIPTKAEDTKGWAETVVVSLASAGTFTVALQTIQAWLTRDRTRTLEISIEVDGVTHTFTLKGTEIDAELVKRLTSLAIAQFEKDNDQPDQPA